MAAGHPESAEDEAEDEVGITLDTLLKNRRREGTAGEERVQKECAIVDGRTATTPRDSDDILVEPERRSAFWLTIVALGALSVFISALLPALGLFHQHPVTLTVLAVLAALSTVALLYLAVQHALAPKEGLVVSRAFWGLVLLLYITAQMCVRFQYLFIPAAYVPAFATEPPSMLRSRSGSSGTVWGSVASYVIYLVVWLMLWHVIGARKGAPRPTTLKWFFGAFLATSLTSQIFESAFAIVAESVKGLVVFLNLPFLIFSMYWLDRKYPHGSADGYYLVMGLFFTLTSAVLLCQVLVLNEELGLLGATVVLQAVAMALMLVTGLSALRGSHDPKLAWVLILPIYLNVDRTQLALSAHAALDEWSLWATLVMLEFFSLLKNAGLWRMFWARRCCFKSRSTAEDKVAILDKLVAKGTMDSISEIVSVLMRLTAVLFEALYIGTGVAPTDDGLPSSLRNVTRSPCMELCPGRRRQASSLEQQVSVLLVIGVVRVVSLTAERFLVQKMYGATHTRDDGELQMPTFRESLQALLGQNVMMLMVIIINCAITAFDALHVLMYRYY